MARTDLSWETFQFPEPEGPGPLRRARRRSRRRIIRRVVFISLAMVLLAAGIGGLLTYRTYEARSRLILRGIRIAGVDVGGLTWAEAVGRVSADVRQDLSQPLEVRAGKREWLTSPWDLGVRADVGRAVDEAFGVSDSLSWYSRVSHRLRNTPVYRSIGLSFHYPDADARALVRRIGQAMHVPPRSAAIKLVQDALAFEHSRPGRDLDTKKGLKALLGAVRSRETEVTLPVRRVSPAVTEATLGKTITIDLTTNTLRLYEGFDVGRTYPVATAKQGFATPVGTWEVISKVVNPSWTNPDPTGWGAGEPLFIPPGPSNPLGLRALYLDAPGIRIHGTPVPSSIGTYASHGCIRMFQQDVIALFPLVPMGTPVIIYGAPPWGLGGPVGVPGT